MSLPLIVLMAAISAAMVIYSLMPRKVDKRRKALQRLDGKARIGDKKPPKFDRRKSGAMENLIAKAAPTLSKASMPKTEEARTNIRMKLANAGIRSQQAPAIFLASKTILGIAFTIVALLVAMSARMSMRHTLGLVAGCGAVGLMLPNLWLSLAIKSRKEKVAFGMPDSLDLMVAINYANMAMDLVERGATGRMVALQSGVYTHVPIGRKTEGTKQVDVDELYDLDEYRPKILHTLGKPMFLY